jgi:CubicO group peptidase (beta-lactamase class C family)
MKRNRAALIALCIAPLFAAATNSVNLARLKQIPARMQKFVDDQSISGAVTLVAHRGQIVELDAVGYSDIEKKKPMRTDSIVQIMSQTKTFTGVAAMMLVEQGKLDLTRPVQDYLPEFKGQLVEEKHADGTITTHRPEHPITVLQVASHTSGFAFLPATGPLHRINFTLDRTLEEAVRGYANEHLINDPGTKYLYSNMGIATLGRIVEVVSGEEYSHFVQTHILDPLGMKDSFYYPPESKKDRIAMIYQHEDGKLVLSRERAQAGDPALYRPGAKYPGPELGLYSTASDLFRFYQMLANGGELGGHRLLSKRAVEAMRQDYTPAHNGYGIAMSITNERSLLNLVGPGSFGHGGAFGTLGQIDPKSETVVVFLPQMNDGTSNAAKNAFLQMAESAIE